jgi:hypothetical protein
MNAAFVKPIERLTSAEMKRPRRSRQKPVENRIDSAATAAIRTARAGSMDRVNRFDNMSNLEQSRAFGSEGGNI